MRSRVVARRRERLRELKKEIIGTRVRILPLDLMEEESFERLKMVLAKEQPVVRILVNASGYGIRGLLNIRQRKMRQE